MANPERWYPKSARRAFYRVMAGYGVLTLGYVVYRVVADEHESRNDVILTVLFALQGIVFVSQWQLARWTYVEADDDGVVTVADGRRRTIPWADVAELRPHVPYSWATHLVIIRRDGERIDLPLPADHRGLVDRWDAVASRRETSRPEPPPT